MYLHAAGRAPVLIGEVRPDEAHPNYRYTADADPKNVFDMERYMKKQRAVVKPTDSFDVYEIDVTE